MSFGLNISSPLLLLAHGDLNFLPDPHLTNYIVDQE